MDIIISSRSTAFMRYIFCVSHDAIHLPNSATTIMTNAGKLMTDQHTVYNSRMFCTRWNSLEKGSIFDDALDDKEYEGNLIYLLNSGRFQSHLEKCKLHISGRFSQTP